MSFLVVAVVLLAGFSLWAAVAIIKLQRQVRRLASSTQVEQRPQSLGHIQLSEVEPLSGLRFALLVRQDHELPVVAQALQSQLLSLGATSCSVLQLREEPDWSGNDYLVIGEVKCNGYADVYFSADLEVRTPAGSHFRFKSDPPQGDRTANLALAFTHKLVGELSKAERQLALKELN